MKPNPVARSELPPLLLSLLLVLTACTTADVLRVDPLPRPARDPATVEVLFQQPTRAFKVIAWISAANKTTVGVSSQKIVNRLRKEAAKLGADALLVTGASSQIVGGNVVMTPYGATIDGKRQNQYNAAAIVWQGQY